MLMLGVMGRDWLAFGVAAYGAVVATGVAVYQFVRDRPGVKIVLTPVNVSYKDGESRDFWGIRVVNHRKRPITIRDGGLLGERGELIHTAIVDLDDPAISRDPFPKTLTDGISFEFYVPLNRARDHERCGAWAVDDLGRTFKTHLPSHSPRRRWREWRARRRFEKAVVGPSRTR